jgi:hypothetical protein
MGGRITKTIVINVGSKERDNEETTRSFNNDVSFELDDWNHIEEYALSGLNLEDKLSQGEQKPAAVLTKNPSVSPSAIPHKKPSAEPVAIPHENTAIILPEDGKNDDDIDEDKRKPAANQQEEMLTTEIQEQFIQNTIPSLPGIGGKVVPWICEFCYSQWPQSQKRCGTCKRWKGGKRSSSNKKDNQEQTVSKNKAKKWGRKSKTLPPIPAQEVIIPLELGSALELGNATCSLLTGGVNANYSSIGPSIGMSSYDDSTIGDNTVSQDTNDELVQILDDIDANETGDGGTSDAECDGYECVHSFKNGMKEVELERLCFDANEIDSGVEVDDNDAFMCEVTDESVQSRLYRVPPGWSTPCAPDDWNPTINRNKGSHYFKMWIIQEVGAHILSDQYLNQEVENTSGMPCLLALFLYLLML